MPALLGLLVTLTGCAEEPLPERTIRADDCLRDVQIKELKQAIRRCDGVVKAFPDDPAPLNDRFLLHTLNGDNDSACRDITRAVTLAGRKPPASLDPLLKEDLRLRAASCAG
jgi:hypothetical protein